MKKKYKIHFFCSSPDLCQMVEKYFVHTKFIVKTICIKNTEHFSGEKLNYKPDCIIIDPEIKFELRKKIASSNEGSKVIYLPSLSDGEAALEEGTEIIKVSEPLKLSELEMIINNYLFVQNQQ